MKRYLQTLRSSPLTHGAGGLLIALVCVVALFGCKGKSDTTNNTTTITAPTSTLGALNVNVTPASATVVMTGPSSYAKTFSGSQLLADLEPGQYTASATATGYGSATNQINVVGGHTSSISLVLVLQSTSIVPPGVTVGSLNVNVTPASAAVVVTGPSSFSQTFTGNQFLTDLAPGQYTAKATAPGFADASSQINVVVGQTSSITLALLATPIIAEAPRTVYRDGSGNLIPLNSTNVQAGKFVFYAWLQDLPSGILTTKLTSSTSTDPGAPLLTEQTEFAPSFTQNLAAAWVGFADPNGVVRPVIGADVRWEIDQQYAARVGSTQFGTSDDNRSALNYGVFDDQADTRTNNAHLDNERFPLIATQYPLYDVTGVLAPYVDGFTWVTLFSPDKLASSRIVAVATVNGEEIGKQILFKNFAPAPKLQITKTVDQAFMNLDVANPAIVNWTVAVTNIGDGNATNVNLNDILTTLNGATYTATAPSGGTLTGPGNDGFTDSFPLASGSTATLTFTGSASASGTYCNEAIISQYTGSNSTVTPVDLNATACFTAVNSNVSIVKDFVAADNTTSLGKARTVGPNVPAKLRVQVINAGVGSATGVSVRDTLTSGSSAAYALIGSPSSGVTNTLDGFDTNLGVLSAGTTTTILFTVAASADGTYCDTALVSAITGSIGIGSDSACLTVSTPNLTITKTDAPSSVLPGSTYTSTIVVHNTGSATANNVVISDLIGQNAATSAWVIYVSSSQNGVGGTLTTNTVTANSIDLASGGTATFTVVSRIPAGVSGNFCDTATVTSSNAASKNAPACVTVPAYVALQTQLVDLNDPVAVGSSVTYASVLYVEALSNEGASNTRLTYSFGLTSPTVLEIPGVFRVTSTKIYLDTAPVRDPVTGLVVSDPSNATARLLTEGTDYTLNNTTPGLQLVTMATGVILQPNTALYLQHVCLVPTGTTANAMYTTSYVWRSVGLVSGTTYVASSSEPTTVLP